jgi:hypothetical protein
MTMRWSTAADVDLLFVIKFLAFCTVLFGVRLALLFHIANDGLPAVIYVIAMFAAIRLWVSPAPLVSRGTAAAHNDLQKMWKTARGRPAAR